MLVKLCKDFLKNYRNNCERIAEDILNEISKRFVEGITEEVSKRFAWEIFEGVADEIPKEIYELSYIWIVECISKKNGT